MSKLKKAIKEVKDPAPGKDCVRIKYIWNACEEIKNQLKRTITFMFNNRANKWEDTIKEGHMVPIFKKGNRNSPGNYRGVVLLAWVAESWPGSCPTDSDDGRSTWGY